MLSTMKKSTTEDYDARLEQESEDEEETERIEKEKDDEAKKSTAQPRSQSYGTAD